MTKRDLAMRVARKAGVNGETALRIIDATFDAIRNELGAGRRLEFRNFGVFELAVRRSRPGRNPAAPENVVIIPERVAVKFKPGKLLAEKVMLLKPSDIEKD